MKTSEEVKEQRQQLLRIILLAALALVVVLIVALAGRTSRPLSDQAAEERVYQELLAIDREEAPVLKRIRESDQPATPEEDAMIWKNSRRADELEKQHPAAFERAQKRLKETKKNR